MLALDMHFAAARLFPPREAGTRARPLRHALEL